MVGEIGWLFLMQTKDDIFWGNDVTW